METTNNRNVQRQQVVALAKRGYKQNEIIKLVPGISKSTICRWVNSYIFEGKVERKQKTTEKSVRYKEQVISLHRAGLSAAEIHRKIKTIALSTIYSWIGREVDSAPCKESKMSKKIRKITPAVKVTPLPITVLETVNYEDLSKEELIAKCRQFETKLKYSEAKALVLNKMIDISEREFGIAIRKKFGAK